MYRDDREAMLARARALTAELKSARAEIAKLERQLRGEADEIETPAMTPEQAEINAELDSARVLLAGLLSDEDPAEPLIAAEFNKTYTERDAVLDALQRALLAVLARKMGEVPKALVAHIETLVTVDGLIKRIANCAAESDEAALREIVVD